MYDDEATHALEQRDEDEWADRIEAEAAQEEYPRQEADR
jgi:hypothetical protein